MILKLENISKSFITGYKRNVVLKEINFSINKSDSLGVIGKNGSGKSTLLGLISGIILPDSGKIKKSGTISWPVGKVNCFPRIAHRKTKLFFCM